MPTPTARLRAGRWLRAQRESRKMLQGTLAHHLGVSQQSLSGYELGRTSVPDDVAAKVARIFGLSESDARRALGLHVPGDIEVETEIIDLPVVPRNEIAVTLPPGVSPTPALRRAVEALVEAVVDQFPSPPTSAGGDPDGPVMQRAAMPPMTPGLFHPTAAEY